jgi:hypothetical protein
MSNSRAQFGFTPEGNIVVAIDFEMSGKMEHTYLTFSPAAAREFANQLLANINLAEGVAKNVRDGANLN